MMQLNLTNWPEPAILDDQFTLDMALVHNEKWSACIVNNKVKGVHTYSKILNGEYPYRSTIYLHWVATGIYTKMIDHIDGNSLNNLKSNLRVCSRSQNGANRKKQSKPSSSKYKGVMWSKYKNKWVAAIQFKGKKISIGSFINEEDAALAYNKVTLNLNGRFAKINDIINNNLT